MPTSAAPTNSTWLRADQCRLEDLQAITSEQARQADYRFASSIDSNVVIYKNDVLVDSARQRDHSEQDQRGHSEQDEVMAELANVLLDGPGIMVIRDAVPTDAVDSASQVFAAIIDEQHRTNTGAGDHFAKPGANDRIWNAQEKLALSDPLSFACYYAAEAIALVSEAYLGPGYQITSQVNVVNPGGEAQSPHRDYHLGFMTEDQAARYPAHIHRLSPVLTLQGAVAHCDMPVETGPTMYLPHSQKYEAGYLAWRLPEFIEFFAEQHVQLELNKGDAVFFNPALFHAAGTNRTTDVKRMGNLLQVSSVMGRAMENVNRRAMSEALYPVLASNGNGQLTDDDVRRVVQASAEAYAFPTNLDRDQPVDGLAPRSQADVVMEALAQNLSPAELATALRVHAEPRS